MLTNNEEIIMPVTANSFILINATPERIAQLDSALKYLQNRSPDMARPILEAAAENQVRIVFSDPQINPPDAYGLTTGRTGRIGILSKQGRLMCNSQVPNTWTAQ
jgi:hypothetical protein